MKEKEINAVNLRGGEVSDPPETVWCIFHHSWGPKYESLNLTLHVKWWIFQPLSHFLRGGMTPPSFKSRLCITEPNDVMVIPNLFVTVGWWKQSSFVYLCLQACCSIPVGITIKRRTKIWQVCRDSVYSSSSRSRVENNTLSRGRPERK